MCAYRVVVDKELITGLPDGKEANCMAVYQVNEKGLISRVSFARSLFQRGISIFAPHTVWPCRFCLAGSIRVGGCRSGINGMVC
jgi:hypothetical protein